MPGRLLMAVLAVVAVGCSTNPAATGVEVTVVLEDGLQSRCVRVSVSDADDSIESDPLVIGTKRELKVGIVPVAGLASPIKVRAFGFLRVDCSEPVPGEVSEEVTANFSKAVDRVTVTLRPAPMDGGVDLDGDGYSPPRDCNDFDPNLNPGKAESCTNGIDDDCDGLLDCRDDTCVGMACAGSGMCVADAGCLQAMEVTCNDGVDNDGDGLTDCEDVVTCLGESCTDGNACSTGDLCQPNGTCLKTADVVCNMPPSPTVCFAPMGVCQADGGTCSYAPTTNACDDGDACTASSACSNGQCVGSNRTQCNMPPMCRMAGACNSATGMCDYPPAPATMGCNDGNNCTTNDRCDGAGTCAGTLMNCPLPNQCQTANGCNTQGVCLFNARTGQPCDAGTPTPGSCDSAANCLPPALFPFQTSNFTEMDLPPMTGALSMNCAVTLDTSTQTVSSNGCGVTMPPSRIFTPMGTGAQSTLLIRLSSMTLNSGADLILTGGRPVIFAVTGDVIINAGARIRATNGASVPSLCGAGGNFGSNSGTGTAGGGGGGFGNSGAVGGNSGNGGGGAAGQANGEVTLSPLRGGCPGGNGTAAGGAGGGAVQISAGVSLVVNGIINAGGVGGRGAAASGGDSGGGGGSGGAILLESTTLRLNSGATVVANGAGGGEGSKGQVGGPGEDGRSSTTAAAGGTGNNGDDGGDGAVQGTNATAGNSAPNNEGGGGGGGGLGRIRLNGHGTCVRNATAVSPSASTSGCP